MNVGQVCSRQVVAASRTASLAEAARLMRAKHVGCVVVVADMDSQMPIGMLTDRDIVVAAVAKEVDPKTLTVGDVMSGGVLVVREHDQLGSALALMREKGVRRVPVVSGKGVLCGLLSFDDLLPVVADELDAFVQTMRSERSREERVRR